jgi:hypothetical protein
MISDSELELLRHAWQADTDFHPGAAPDLLKKVTRQTRLMKLGLIGDSLVTVVMGGGTTAWAFLSPEPDFVLLALATWAFLFAAWIAAWQLNRGNWSPSAMDAAAFVDLSIRRCRSALRLVWFGAALFSSEVVFGLAWVYHHSEPKKSLPAWLLFGSLPIDLVWLFTLAFAGALVWYRRKKRAEMRVLLALADGVTG